MRLERSTAEKETEEEIERDIIGKVIAYTVHVACVRPPELIWPSQRLGAVSIGSIHCDDRI